MNKIEYWNFSDKEIRESAVRMRELSALNYHKKVLSNDKKFKDWVYSFRYDCLRLVEKLIKKAYSGKIMEIGAGTGIYSCILSQYPRIEKIYTLDYSEVCIKELVPFIMSRFNLSESQKNKIYRVVGSFDNIKIADNSLDFIISMGSLHHSEDREKTLRELFRVLKKGGYLIACERASNNNLTNKQLNENLNIEYSDEHKKLMGYEKESKYTRRMNSEHEPLLAEWEYLTTKVGFKSNIFWFQKFSKKSKAGPFGQIFNFFGNCFFRLFGLQLMKKRLSQILHLKILYYPWFSNSKPDDILILAKKVPYYEMP